MNGVHVWRIRCLQITADEWRISRTVRGPYRHLPVQAAGEFETVESFWPSNSLNAELSPRTIDIPLCRLLVLKGQAYLFASA